MFELLTILILVIAAIFVIKANTPDACLSDFDGDLVTVEKTDGKIIWGRLCLSHDAIELIYPEPHPDEEGQRKDTNYIIYKGEYGEIKILIRYIDDQKGEGLKKREKRKKEILSKNAARDINNFLNSIRDLFFECVFFMKGFPKNSVYVEKQEERLAEREEDVKNSLINKAYEPILEKYIGRKVALTVVDIGKKREYIGMLHEYTSEYVEILDVLYKDRARTSPRNADIIVSRKNGIIRHACE